jgi:DNA-binding PadR family transcriptional regulator
VARRTSLSLADLVVLSLLSERPVHGHELWAELQRRHVWKWAEISRPQVYYSLKKLEAAGHVELAGEDDPSLGPERRTLKPTAHGRRALSDGLARAEWATHRPPSPFLTWMVLSWQARPRDFVTQVERRQKFLRSQLEEDSAALDAVIAETSASSDAAMVVRLGLRQFETELAWLDAVAKRHRPG